MSSSDPFDGETLSRLLGGSVDAFLRDVWQAAPLKVAGGFGRRREEANRGSGKPDAAGFSIVNVEELFHEAFRRGDADSILTFSGGKQVDARNPFFAYSNRCSVVVNRADRFCRPIYTLCEAVAHQGRFPYVFCNVYLTPPKSQTVPAHSDDRDVLLVQIMGRKHWTVYGRPPVVLPYKDEEVGKKASPLSREALDAMGVAWDGFVEAGDVLYLPRGWVHEAKTQEDSASLHLTLAIQTSDWDPASLLRTELQHALRAIPSSRHCLSREAMAQPKEGISPQLSSSDLAAWRQTVSELAQHLDPHRGLRDFHERLRRMRLERAELFTEEDKVRGVVAPPVTLHTLIAWNGCIKVAACDQVSNHPVAAVTALLRLERQLLGDPPSSLTMSASREVVAVVRQLSSCPEAPRSVQELVGPFDDLSRLCLANLLLRNDTCVRIRD